jgi:hypothetical protein
VIEEVWCFAAQKENSTEGDKLSNTKKPLQFPEAAF